MPEDSAACCTYIGLMADHHHDRAGAQSPERPQRVVQERPATQLVQHLGTGGLHPRAEASREYNCSYWVLSRHGRRAYHIPRNPAWEGCPTHGVYGTI